MQPISLLKRGGIVHVGPFLGSLCSKWEQATSSRLGDRFTAEPVQLPKSFSLDTREIKVIRVLLPMPSQDREGKQAEPARWLIAPAKLGGSPQPLHRDLQQGRVKLNL